MDIKDIIDIIKVSAFEVRKHLCQGYLESVYRNALQIELQSHGLRVVCEYPIPVYYKGSVVGDFRADLIVEESVIIELKAVRELNTIHEIQLVNYLNATGIDRGLLINYGGDRYSILEKTRRYSGKQY